MGKKRSERPLADSAKTAGRFDSPFAGLAGLRDSLPAGETPPEGESLDGGQEPATSGAPKRAVVRYQRKGRGGKEVTLVEKLGLPDEELTRWLKRAKQDLGCGGAIDGDALALQGDQRQRLAAWLRRRGALGRLDPRAPPHHERGGCLSAPFAALVGGRSFRAVRP